MFMLYIYMNVVFQPLTEREVQVLDAPEVRKLLAPTVDLVSDDEASGQSGPVLAVGGQSGPVADDEASGEESESLSPPVVDGPYFDSHMQSDRSWTIC